MEGTAMSLYTGGLSVLLNLMPTRFFTVAVPPVPGTKISTGPPWAMLRS